MPDLFLIFVATILFAVGAGTCLGYTLGHIAGSKQHRRQMLLAMARVVGDADGSRTA